MSGSRARRLPARLAPVLSLVALLTTLAIAGVSPAAAGTLPGLTIGISSEDAMVASSVPTELAWDRLARSDGVSFVRVAINWAEVAPAVRPPGFNPSNSSSPGYDWSQIDEAVRTATARGLKVLVMIYSVPRWAEGPNRPPNLQERRGIWDPSVSAFTSFSTAAARRYSGSFPDPLHPGTSLPAVRYWQGWNEPNLDYYLSPVWAQTSRGYADVAADLYRRMENSFYAAIKAVSRSNFVLLAGTGPYGDPPGQARIRPLVFYRDLFCLNHALGCPAKIHLDGLDHHPYEFSSPAVPAFYPDDIAVPDVWKIERVVQQGVRAGYVVPRGPKPLWVNELAWDTRPPKLASGAYSLATQARWVALASYLLWREGVHTLMWLQIRDLPVKPGFLENFSWSGMYFNSGAPKPSATALRFPFVSQREDRKHVLVWGRPPASGLLTVYRKRGSGGWAVLTRVFVRALQVFEVKHVRLRGSAVLWASVAGQSSLQWTQN